MFWDEETRGPDSCFPILWHGGCECWVYVVVMSVHEVVLYYHPYRGNPYKYGALTVVHHYCDTTKWFCSIIHIGGTLINMGPWQLFSIIVTRWVWVMPVHEVVFCLHPYRETLINMGPWQLFSNSVPRWVWALRVRSGYVCPQSGFVSSSI